MDCQDVLICLHCGWEGAADEEKNPICAYGVCPECGHTNLRWKDYYEKNKVELNK